MARQNDKGLWCRGHGVPDRDASLRHGHLVEWAYVEYCFTPNQNVDKSLVHGYRSRCDHCRSIRHWHDHHQNAINRANRFRREHANRWVDKGRAPTVEWVEHQMDIGGVTVAALIQLILAAVGKPCPGLCAHEIDGRIIRHTIDKVADLHVDVMDPDKPFTIENIGILCGHCNSSKREEALVIFLIRRKAEHRVWQHAIDQPSYQRNPPPEQLALPFDDVA